MWLKVLSGNMQSVVDWLLNAFAKAKVSTEAMTAHGDISHSTGRTFFLTQTHIIQDARCNYMNAACYKT